MEVGERLKFKCCQLDFIELGEEGMRNNFKLILWDLELLWKFKFVVLRKVWLRREDFFKFVWCYFMDWVFRQNIKEEVS